MSTTAAKRRRLEVASSGWAGYVGRMMRVDKIALILGPTAALLAASPVQAEEKLPGVAGDHRIVKPLPEPINDASQNNDSIKVGDWDVKISGSVTVDIGVGNLPPPRR